LYASADGKQLYIAHANGQVQILDTAAIGTNGAGS
jgi:DNA-binding beta-propeller fold protein YncE